MKKRVITFGEIMLRLAPNGYYRFFQDDQLQATFGGGEANVAVSLANYGMDAAFVSKVPAHEIGLMLSMSLRFVPTLVDDTNRIMNAQRARGVDFGEGNLLKRIRSFIPILIPLFASSFKRADALAIAMEARGYKGGEGRTRYRTLQWGVKDTLALLVILCLMLIVFYLKNG